VVTNGRVLGALRRGHPVWVASVEGLPECSVHEVGPSSKELDPKVRAHRSVRAVILASGTQAHPPEGARELAEGEVLALPRTLDPVRI
jgi:glutamine amidotransferase